LSALQKGRRERSEALRKESKLVAQLGKKETRGPLRKPQVRRNGKGTIQRGVWRCRGKARQKKKKLTANLPDTERHRPSGKRKDPQQLTNPKPFVRRKRKKLAERRRIVFAYMGGEGVELKSLNRSKKQAT